MRKIITEWCQNCETEVELKWDCKHEGYKAFCPKCGKRLMLCDECQHRGKFGQLTDDCDYNRRLDCCRFNKPRFLRVQITYDEMMYALKQSPMNGLLHLDFTDGIGWIGVNITESVYQTFLKTLK